MSNETSPPCGRRSFLEKVGWSLGALATAVVATPLVSALLGKVSRRPLSWIDLGPVDRFPLGKTIPTTFTHPRTRPKDGKTAHLAAYVRRTGSRTFLVMSPNCTHLGCPVTWFKESGLFMCPCHGGVYYADGSRAAGPPPRGLYHYPYKVEQDHLKIHGGFIPTLHNTFERPA